MKSGLSIYRSMFKNADRGRGIVGGHHEMFTRVDRHFHVDVNYQDQLQLSYYSQHFPFLGTKESRGNLYEDLNMDGCQNSFLSKKIKMFEEYENTGQKQCSLCEKKFTTNNELKVHSRVHSGAKPFSCTSYIVSSYMSYTCPTCNKSFSRKSSLVIHMRTHTGELPFTCPTCNKSFSRKSNLVAHMRLHSDEESFKCIQCDKRFSREKKWIY